jgi:hypothetical protein
MARDRKKQIKKWKKKNPGKTELENINSNRKLVEEKIQPITSMLTTVF